MKRLNIKNIPAERLSQRVFYVLVGLCVVVFGLFYMVGYDIPYVFNPDITAPMFTGVVLDTMYVLFLLALACAIWSAIKGFSVSGKSDGTENNVPYRAISHAVFVGTAVILLLALLFGSSKEMVVNGSLFANKFLLKLSDMFIYTIGILLFVAFAAVVFGFTRYYRKK